MANGYWWRSGPVPSLPHVYLIYSLTCVNIWTVIKRGFPLNFIGRSPTEPSLLSPVFGKKEKKKKALLLITLAKRTNIDPL